MSLLVKEGISPPLARAATAFLQLAPNEIAPYLKAKGVSAEIADRAAASVVTAKTGGISGRLKASFGESRGVRLGRIAVGLLPLLSAFVFNVNFKPVRAELQVPQYYSHDIVFHGESLYGACVPQAGTASKGEVACSVEYTMQDVCPESKAGCLLLTRDREGSDAGFATITALHSSSLRAKQDAIFKSVFLPNEAPLPVREYPDLKKVVVAYFEPRQLQSLSQAGDSQREQNLRATVTGQVGQVQANVQAGQRALAAAAPATGGR